MIFLTPAVQESISELGTRPAGNRLQRTSVMGKMNICSNIQECECVCKLRGVHDESIPQDAQTIMEPVWPLGRKQFYKTL